MTNSSYPVARISHFLSRWGAIMLLLPLLIAGGCKSSRIKFPDHGTSGPTFEVNINDENLSDSRRLIIRECHDWLGTPYQYAGYEKGVGADCSGMVLSVYLDATGIKLPRNSAKQAEFCKHIKKSAVKPGDLVFFATGSDPDRISHVGIMIDNVRFIHSSSSKGVCISDVTTPYYTRTFKMYGRVPGL